MKIWIRNTLFLAAVAVTAVCIAIVCSLERNSRALLACNDICIEFKDTLGFISASDVKKCIKDQYGDVTGRQIDAIDLTRIEQIMEGTGAVKNCETWATRDGKLHVLISQRHPAMYLTNGNSRVYVDFDGFRFRSLNACKENVPEIMTGSWTPSDKWIGEMIGFVRFISGEGRWIDRIEKITSRSNGEISFILSDGGEEVLFGQPVRIKEKFTGIDKYLTNVRSLEKKYKTVNVMYSGHIICK